MGSNDVLILYQIFIRYMINLLLGVPNLEQFTNDLKHIYICNGNNICMHLNDRQ
jgi:hypothetical protein